MLANPLHPQHRCQPGASGSPRDTARHRCRSGGISGSASQHKVSIGGATPRNRPTPGVMRHAMVQTSAASGERRSGASCCTTPYFLPQLQTASRLPGVGPAPMLVAFALDLRLTGGLLNAVLPLRGRTSSRTPPDVERVSTPSTSEGDHLGLGAHRFHAAEYMRAGARRPRIAEAPSRTTGARITPLIFRGVTE